MFPGLFTLCLNTRNLDDMRRFYTDGLGFKVHLQHDDTVVVNNGDVDIALMTFLDGPSLNFRGADPFALREHLGRSSIAASGEPSAYETGAGGAGQWAIRDPDGNHVFVDTNAAETGAAGRALALQRILDATLKQLVNFGASNSCVEAFRDRVVEVLLPVGQRPVMDNGLNTAALTEPGTYAGSFTLCIKTASTTTSRDFYRALGLEVTGNDDAHWVQMSNGDCTVSLMSFLDANWLNFRGADPFEMHERLRGTGLALAGAPERYSAEDFGNPGAHWQTRDPDGNVVYFDTSDPEIIEPGDPERVKGALDRAARQLRNIGAEPSPRDILETEMSDWMR